MRSLFALAALLAAAPAFAQSDVPQQPGSELDGIPWKPLSTKQPVGGPVIHVLWGSPPQKAGGFLMRLSGEAELPLRRHASEYQVVVIQGTWVHATSLTDSKEFRAGTYWTQKANQRHRDRCVAGPDCVVLVRTTGKFDIKSSEPTGIAVEPAPKPTAVPSPAATSAPRR